VFIDEMDVEASWEQVRNKTTCSLFIVRTNIARGSSIARMMNEKVLAELLAAAAIRGQIWGRKTQTGAESNYRHTALAASIRSKSAERRNIHRGAALLIPDSES